MVVRVEKVRRGLGDRAAYGFPRLGCGTDHADMVLDLL